MSRYKQGLSIDALRDQYESDLIAKTEEEIILLYGRDKPRFAGLNAQERLRPTSFHLRSPLYVDEQGRQYTPVSEPKSKDWWIRVPAGITRKMNKALREGEDADKYAVDFPMPGDALILRQVQYGRHEVDPFSLPVRVQTCTMTRARASALITFDAEIVSTRNADQIEALEAREQRDLERRQRRADRLY